MHTLEVSSLAKQEVVRSPSISSLKYSKSSKGKNVKLQIAHEFVRNVWLTELIPESHLFSLLIFNMVTMIFLFLSKQLPLWPLRSKLPYLYIILSNPTKSVGRFV